MDFQIGDSRTWQPFRKERTTKKEQAAQQTSLLNRFFQRLGFHPKPDESSSQTSMKELEMLVPCIAGGKPRRKGEVVTIPDLQAAELISMKVASLRKDVPNTKLQPWERPRAKPAAKPETPAVK